MAIVVNVNVMNLLVRGSNPAMKVLIDANNTDVDLATLELIASKLELTRLEANSKPTVGMVHLLARLSGTGWTLINVNEERKRN